MPSVCVIEFRFCTCKVVQPRGLLPRRVLLLWLPQPERGFNDINTVSRGSITTHFPLTSSFLGQICRAFKDARVFFRNSHGGIDATPYRLSVLRTDSELLDVGTEEGLLLRHLERCPKREFPEVSVLLKPVEELEGRMFSEVSDVGTS